MAVKDVDNKKLVLLYLEKIFLKYSDEVHPLRQQDILAYLESDYNMVVERRTVGRSIEYLKRSGMDIVSGRKGSYLNSRDFTDGELKLLIDGVLSSKYINNRHSQDLIDKLCSLSNVYFDRTIGSIQSVNVNKTENPNLFYNIEETKRAIKENNQITFDFYKYGVDKKMYKSKTHVVTPLCMVLHNQRYYLFAINEKYKTTSFYRIDHIKNLQVLEEVVATNIKTIKGFENGIDYKTLNNRPYLFSDEAKDVVFYADEHIIDQLIDWFGNSITFYRKESDPRIRCEVTVSLQAMEIWAMQYLNYVEIVEPKCLRDKIKENLNKAVDKYN